MKNQRKQSSDFSSQEEILLPMCSLLPANEIITKQYQIDQEPIMKLITKQVAKQKQQEKNMYHFDPPKNYNPQFVEYGQLFGTSDYLGAYYANKMDQMVYFKFNNKQYNQLKVADKKYRFFSGFFVDRQHFAEVASQKHDNIMKSFPFIDFQDYNSNILQSFGKNAKGTSLDPKFSSNYDSANLFASIRRKPFQYDLILQNDTNSKGNNQWFNFLVNFTQEGKYRFNIVNFTKSHSLYEQGMKIACFSYMKYSHRGGHQNQKSGVGWFRGCNNIKYFKNNIQRESLTTNQSYYTLSFEYTCKNRNQSIIFSHSVPYTGLDLEKFFHRIIYRKAIGHLKVEKIHICQSLAGQQISGYMITHRKMRSNSMKFKSSFCMMEDTRRTQERHKTFNFSKLIEKKFSYQKENEQSLKSVVIMARQHSGQTQSSFVLEGIVQFLMANSQLDQTKKNFIFFILPMVNIDGVKYGHYRTNMNGVDLNRIWRVPRKQLHPQVYYVKKFMCQINKSNPISMILDIHGHSKSLNSFFYGNPSPKKQSLNIQDPKIFPYICSKRIKQISYKQSTFNVREDKKNSARVVLSQLFPKALVYTLQNSFYGYTVQKQSGKTQIVQYTPQSYRRVGRQLMTTYLEYTRLIDKNANIKVKWAKQMESVYVQMEKSRVKQVYTNEQDDGGSDSEAQNQLIQFQQPKQQIKQSIQRKDNVVSPSPKRQLYSSPSYLNTFKRTPGCHRRSQKKRSMPLPRTLCDDRVRGFNQSTNLRSMLSPASDMYRNNKPKESEKQVQPTKNQNYPQAVLSIFKIQTKKTSNILRKKSSMSGFLRCNKQNTTIVSNGSQNKLYLPVNSSLAFNFQDSNSKKYLNPSNEKVVPDKNSEYEKRDEQVSKLIKNNRNSQQNQAIHYKKKLYRKESQKEGVQSAIKKCSGMKTFLKAMGITIQNRNAC